MGDRPPNAPQAGGRRYPHWRVWAALLAVAAGFIALPAVTGTPERLIEGCVMWILIAAPLELLSALGFVLVFKLVFGARMSWRRSAPASLRALGISALLPGGGLIGPAAGAWSAGPEKPSISGLACSTVTLAILTEAPGVIVLGVLGISLRLGLASGPHAIALTLLPATAAPALIMAIWLVPRSSRRPPSGRGPGHRRAAWLRLTKPVGTLREGAIEAHMLLRGCDWKLGGALAYYALDNAVLWAAFHAYGRTPPLGVVVMGYLLGSLGSALPLPGGLGVAGGMIGALVLYGAPAPAAAAAVLLYRGISLSVPLALGAAAWTAGPAATAVLRVNAGRIRRWSGARETPAALEP